jgi:hypothetical protein
MAASSSAPEGYSRVQRGFWVCGMIVVCEVSSRWTAVAVVPREAMVSMCADGGNVMRLYEICRYVVVVLCYMLTVK